MYDIIIIGGGPAGLTAALYARRANKTVLIIEKGSFGGQITYSPKVENIPGTKVISGAEFAENLSNQAMNLGAEVELEAGTMLYFKSEQFEDEKDFGSAIECLMKSHERYNPKEFGYEYDCENAPVFNFGASLEMGAKIAFPVKKC